MDTARQYITDVMARLADPMLLGEAVDYAVSKLVADENTKPRRIDWWYGKIRHLEPTNGTIYTEHQDLIVRIWDSGADLDESETKTRILKNRLLAAAREVALTSFVGTIEVGDFDWSEEQHQVHGRWLEGTITVPLPVQKRDELFADITAVGVKGFAVIAEITEVVCEDNFEDP